MCTDRDPTACCTPRSHVYDARGVRTDPRPGVFWIPQRDFARVVDRARSDPRVLNCYRFEPSSACAPDTPARR